MSNKADGLISLHKVLNFWERYQNLNLKIAFILMSLQVLHLYWLTTDVVLQRIVGDSYFGLPSTSSPLFVVVDYIEIPALVSGITFYSLSLIRKIKDGQFMMMNFIFLVLLVTQVVHIFWITDEIVYESFFGGDLVIFPIYLAWIAILIDYLEIPVMIDLFRRVFSKENETNQQVMK
jgi:hypothetical protein